MKKSTITLNAFSRSVVDDIICDITGCNFSPSSTAISFTRFRALSSPASTVVFCTLNSFVTDVASSNAAFATTCCCRTISMLPARAEITAEALAPSSPISRNTGASTSIPPNCFILSKSISKPSFVERSNAALNSCRSRPVAFAIFSVSLNRFITNFDIAVADISTA